LSPEQQSIAAISALTARGDNTAALQSALNNGLDNGLSVNEIKEVMVHLYAYSGFPRSLGGLNTFMAVMGEREARGIEDEVGEAASAQPDDGNAYARGEKVLATIGSGWSPTAPQSGYVAFAPVIEQFLREHLFGDIFGRDILSYSEREIVTISALASMDGVDPYLSSHMGIGMNVGLTEAQISGILSVVGTHVAEAGREILSRVGLHDRKRKVALRAEHKTTATEQKQTDPRSRRVPRFFPEVPASPQAITSREPSGWTWWSPRRRPSTLALATSRSNPVPERTGTSIPAGRSCSSPEGPGTTRCKASPST